MSRTVVGGLAGATAVALLAAGAACGAFEEGTSEPSPDGSADAAGDVASSADGDTVADGGDGGVDPDASAKVSTLTTIQSPWYISDTVGFVVVTSRVANGGVFRVSKANGNTEKIGLRPAFGVTIRGLDVWYCSADSSNYGLVNVALMGGSNVPRTSTKCLEVAAGGPGGSEVFFTGGDRDSVDTLLPDGGVASVAADNPEGVAADGQGVYWAELHGNVIRAVKAGANGSPSTVVSGIGPEPRRIALRNDYIYWVENLTRDVQRTKSDGSGGAELIAQGVDETRSGGIAVDLQNVYWVVSKSKADSGTGGGVYRVPLSGGTVTPILENLDLPVDVAVDNDFVYVTVQNENRVVRIVK